MQTQLEAKEATGKHSLSNEKPRRQFSKLHTDGTTSAGVGTTVTGSAKANSRSINSVSRQNNKSLPANAVHGQHLGSNQSSASNTRHQANASGS